MGPPEALCPLLHNTCVTYWAPCCAIGHLILISQPLPWKVEDFPEVTKYPKHVLLPNRKLTCNQKALLGRFYFCIGPVTEHCINHILVLNLLFNSSVCSLLLLLSTRQKNLLIGSNL